MITIFRTHASGYFVEKDTIFSAKGSPEYILTFYIMEIELFMVRLLNNCTERAILSGFDKLEKNLGTYDFISVFEVCLTDRENEFLAYVSLKTGISEVQRTSIYYCDIFFLSLLLHVLFKNILRKLFNKLFVIKQLYI